VHKQILNAKLQIGDRGQKKRADWEKFIKEGTSALGCSATEEEEGGGGGEV
jgi:hypothetical protein